MVKQHTAREQGDHPHCITTANAYYLQMVAGRTSRLTQRWRTLSWVMSDPQQVTAFEPALSQSLDPTRVGSGWVGLKLRAPFGLSLQPRARSNVEPTVQEQ